MEKMFRVPLKYGGYKYFYGENAEEEANDYERKLKQLEIEEKEKQKREQEERAKAIAKAEAERKAKEQTSSTLAKEIDRLAKELSEKVKEYETTMDEPLHFITENGELKVRKKVLYERTYMGVPLYRYWA